MKAKRFVALVLCLVLAFSLTSCRSISSDITALLTPPDPAGEMGLIKKALETYAKTGFTLKYPETGKYQSPFIVQDIDADLINEAFAFYSTTTDSVATLHIAYIRNVDGKWVTVNDNSIIATGVEQILFSDMDNDGTNEIIVGWNVFGTADRQVAIYSVADGTLTQRLLEKYSGFIICDLDGNSKNELFINYQNIAEKSAVARLFSLTKQGVTEIANCPLDASVTQHSLPQISKANNQSAIFIDAQKGTGMLTEVIMFNESTLSSIFYDPLTKETTATYRNASITSRDFDSDGSIDIPVMKVLPTAEQLTDSERAYITEWSSVEDSALTPKVRTIMNYTDGYYLLLPDFLSEENITLTRKISSRLRIIYLWDKKDNMALNELFRVQLVSETEWDSSGYDRGSLVEVIRQDGTVYTASLSTTGANPFTVEQLKQMLNLIG